MQRLFIQRGHRRSLLIGEESDGGHRIKRALYIGIKRLWIKPNCISCQSCNCNLKCKQSGGKTSHSSRLRMVSSLATAAGGEDAFVDVGV